MQLLLIYLLDACLQHYILQFGDSIRPCIAMFQKPVLDVLSFVKLNIILLVACWFEHQLSHCVLGQDISPALLAGGGQRALWHLCPAGSPL